MLVGPMRFFIMRKIKLLPKTRHGANVVLNHGEDWDIVMKSENVIFSTEKNWLLLKSPKDRDMRWVQTNNDVDFNIKKLG